MEKTAAETAAQKQTGPTFPGQIRNAKFKRRATHQRNEIKNEKGEIMPFIVKRRLGPNDKCHCSSNKKYKKCHGR